MFLQAVSQGIPNVHFFQLTSQNLGVSPEWCIGHPSAVAHRAIAQQLVDFIGDIMPDWNNTQPINMTVDQVGSCLHKRKNVIFQWTA